MYILPKVVTNHYMSNGESSFMPCCQHCMKVWGNWNMERCKLKYSLLMNMSTCKIPQAKYYGTQIKNVQECQVCTELKISHLHVNADELSRSKIISPKHQ